MATKNRGCCHKVSILALSVFASQIHLSQRERPWQKDEVCVDCQGLSLWESWRVKRLRGLGRFRKSRNKKQGLLHTSMRAAAPFVWGTCRAACGMHSRGRWLLKMVPQFMRRFLRSSTKPAASRNMPLRAVPTTASQFEPLAVSTAEEAVFTVPSRWR